jgi:uncharacterized protein (TIGR02722 family)
MKRSILVVIIAALAVTGCSTRRTVQRIDARTQIDLSGRWNDTDSKLVAEEMIRDSLSRPWLADFVEYNKRRPTMIVGLVLNKTHELISVDTFINDIEREYVNSGRVSVVQGGEARNELRNERADQQEFASPQTMKQWGREKGADFMMQGVINSIVDTLGKEKVVFYQINMELTNIETNEKVWIGAKEIKKYITN